MATPGIIWDDEVQTTPGTTVLPERSIPLEDEPEPGTVDALAGRPGDPRYEAGMAIIKRPVGQGPVAPTPAGIVWDDERTTPPTRLPGRAEAVIRAETPRDVLGTQPMAGYDPLRFGLIRSLGGRVGRALGISMGDPEVAGPGEGPTAAMEQMAGLRSAQGMPGEVPTPPRISGRANMLEGIGEFITDPLTVMGSGALAARGLRGVAKAAQSVPGLTAPLPAPVPPMSPMARTRPPDVENLMRAVQDRREQLSQMGSNQRTLEATRELATGRVPGAAEPPTVLPQTPQGRLPGRTKLEPMGPGAMRVKGMPYEVEPGTYVAAAKDEPLKAPGLDLGEVGRRRAATQGQIEDAPTLAKRLREEDKIPKERASLSIAKSPHEPELSPVRSNPVSEALGEVEKEATGGLKGFVKAWRRFSTENALARHGWAVPEQVAKASPQAAKVVEKGEIYLDLADSLDTHFRRNMLNAYGKVAKNETSLKKVNQLLDTEDGAAIAAQVLSPEELLAYKQARTVFDEVGQSLNLPPGTRVTDYFPRIRQELESEVTRTYKVGDKKFYRTTLEGLARREQNRWFLKKRVSKEPADDLGIEPIIAYLRGASKKIAMEGGVDPRTGKAVKGFLHDIADDLKVPIDNQNVNAFTGEYVNKVVGAGEPAFGAEAGRKIRQYQFARTIGGNPLSPIVNLTQQWLTFSHVKNPLDFVGGYKDLIALAQERMAGQLDGPMHTLLNNAGIKGSLAKGDIDVLERLSATKMDKLTDVLGSAFRFTESTNRSQAFFAGLRDAQRLGLVGDAATQHARKIVDKTQFRMGRESLPLGWQGTGPGSALARPLLQFKGFQLNYARRLKEMLKDDVMDIGGDLGRIASAAKTGDRAAAQAEAIKLVTDIVGSKSMRFWGMGSLLFGTDTMTMGFVDPKTDTTIGKIANGALPALGIWMGHQVGLGALPIEDWKSFMFSLPGPTAAALLDAVGAGASIATGRQYDYDLMNLTNPENGQRPIDWDRTTSKLIRLVPAGVAMDKLRRAMIVTRQEDDEYVRRPMNLPQSLGVEPVPEGAPQSRPMLGRQVIPGRAREAINVGMGTQTPEHITRKRQREDISELQAVERNFVRKAAELMAAGDSEGAMKLLEDNDILSPATMRAVVEAAKRAHLPPETRAILGAPRTLRGRVQERIEEDEE